MQKIVNNPDVLVAYIDLLGYTNLVENNINPDEYYKNINDVLVDFDRLMSGENAGQEGKRSAGLTRECFSINIWSDSFLIALDQKRLCEEEPVSEETAIWRFLAVVSALTSRIFCSTQSLLRGAIIQGQYYQQKFDAFDQSNFISSKALCKAVLLEQSIADTPRILIEQQLAEKFMSYKLDFYFNDSHYSQLLRDLDGLYYLNTYWWEITNKDKRMNILRETSAVLKEHIHKNSRDVAKVRKWIWFANFHNQMIERLKRDGIEKDNPRLLDFYKIALP